MNNETRLAPSVEALAAAPRGDFPVLSRTIDGTDVIYLDNAATTLKPQSVIDAVVDYYARTGANIHRGKHYLSEEASTLYERTRTILAQYLKVPSNEIVMLQNASHALNLVATGLPMDGDDLVVMSLDSHHSAMLPWRRRARVELVGVDADGVIDSEHYHELLRRNPAVVVLTHCSNVTGYYLPLELMAAAAKEAGAVVVVDAVQSIPHRQLHIPDLPIDFLAFSGHKMLGPSGTGVLWGRHEMLSTLDPAYVGGGAVDWVDDDRYDLRKVPHRFEVGTPNIASVIGLGAAVRYLERIGDHLLEEHDRRLGERMIVEVNKRPYLKAIGGAHAFDRAAVVSLVVEGTGKLGNLARILSDSYGIMCRSGHMCAQPLVDRLTDSEVLRISGYVYNTTDEISLVFAALDEIWAVGG